MVEFFKVNAITVVNGGIMLDFAQYRKRMYLLMNLRGQMMATHIILTVTTIMHPVRMWLKSVMKSRNMVFTIYGYRGYIQV